MAHDGTVDYFRDTVFNYPTMAECYKVAAFDGLNKLSLQRLAVIDDADIESLPAEDASLDVDREIAEAAPV